MLKTHKIWHADWAFGFGPVAIHWRTEDEHMWNEFYENLDHHIKASELKEGDVTDWCLKHFRFTAYLTINLREKCVDFVELKPGDIGIICLISLFLAILFRFAQTTYTTLFPIFIGLTMIILLLMYAQISRRRKALEREDTSDGGRVLVDKSQRMKKFDSDSSSLRAYKMACFMLCFYFGGCILSKGSWTTLDGGLTLLALLVVFPILVLSTPRVIPDFASVMAMPPYIGPGAAECALEVMAIFGKEPDGDTGPLRSAEKDRMTVEAVAVGYGPKDVDKAPAGAANAIKDEAPAGAANAIEDDLFGGPMLGRQSASVTKKKKKKKSPTDTEKSAAVSASE